MRHVTTHRERHLARTAQQKLAFAAGVPYEYWKDSQVNLVFKPLEIEGSVLSAKTQRAWMDDLFKENVWKKPYLVVIGSEPTDDTAMVVAMRMVREMLAKKGSPIVQNLGALLPVDEDEDTLAYVGHNVLAEMTWERAQDVRDWITSKAGHFRVLVIAGNPLDAIFRKIRCSPDAILLLDDTKQAIKSIV